MPRRKAAIKREVIPDPLYQSELVARLINVIMRAGKKSIAEHIVYRALELLVNRIKKDNKAEESEAGKGSRKKTDGQAKPTTHSDNLQEKALELLEKALMNIAPPIEVKSRRVGGATYQVPVPVPPERGRALAMRWVTEAAKGRPEKTMADKLSSELHDAYMGRGASIKKCQDVIRMADANKAFAHYRW